MDTAFAIGGPVVAFLLGSFGWQSVFFLMVLPALLATWANRRRRPWTADHRSGDVDIAGCLTRRNQGRRHGG